MRNDQTQRYRSSGPPNNSWAVMPDLQRHFPRPGTRWLWAWRLWYRLRAWWWRVRRTRTATALLGPRYRRARDLIEIDITYLCNLHCLNCNRSVTQAREALHMPLTTIRDFVDASLSRGKRWRRIRVLGGEPTLHPEFDAIITELLRYQKAFPDCIVEVVTNGYGRHVQEALDRQPTQVWVDNSRKTSPIQPHFGPFNLAPVDDPAFRNADYRNGCEIIEVCGMGLTPQGYYPCAVAGGIDRILDAGLGLSVLPNDDDDMQDALDVLCRLCGRFRDGHHIPHVLRPALEGAPMSDTWKELYARWRARREHHALSISSIGKGR